MFSATPQCVLAGILAWRQAMSSRAIARVGATGFSERTCLDARRHFLMISGWRGIGSLVTRFN